MILNNKLILLVIFSKFVLANLLSIKESFKRIYIYLYCGICRFYKIVLTIYKYTEMSL